MKEKETHDLLVPYNFGGERHSYSKKKLPKSYLEKVVLPILLQFPQSSKILDIGSGVGEFAYFVKRCGYQHVISLDPSLVGLRFQRQKLPESATVSASGNFLPFEKKSFDIIHCKDSLVHISDHLRFFSSLRDLLKPQGQLIITTAIGGGNPKEYNYVDLKEILLKMKHSQLSAQVTEYKPNFWECFFDWYKPNRQRLRPIIRQVIVGRKSIG